MHSLHGVDGTQKTPSLILKGATGDRGSKGCNGDRGGMGAKKVPEGSFGRVEKLKNRKISLDFDLLYL